MRALQDAGHDVLILKEHLPQDSDDVVVIAKAQELGAILVSLNGDFADITTYPPTQYHGIVALQVRNHPEAIPSLMRRLTNFFNTHPEMSEYKGRLLLVEMHRIRIRG
jgi:hypothetical protein